MGGVTDSLTQDSAADSDFVMALEGIPDEFGINSEFTSLGVSEDRQVRLSGGVSEIGGVFGGFGSLFGGIGVGGMYGEICEGYLTWVGEGGNGW